MLAGRHWVWSRERPTRTFRLVASVCRTLGSLVVLLGEETEWRRVKAEHVRCTAAIAAALHAFTLRSCCKSVNLHGLYERHGAGTTAVTAGHEYRTHDSHLYLAWGGMHEGRALKKSGERSVQLTPRSG